MFLTGIKTEPIPERILSICQAVEDRGPISRKDLEKLLVPEKLNTAKTSYFGPVFDAATELKLIGTNEHDQIIFIGDHNDIADLLTFRQFCNSVVFSDRTSEFYKIISCFLSANDEWLDYGRMTRSQDVVRIVNQETGIPSLTLQKDVLLGIRFWISFLGFGLYQEKEGIFLPNMYMALKDFMMLGSIQEKEYAVDDFLNSLYPGVSVALAGAKESLSLNLAMSNALRLMHDNQEIQFERHSDSARVWHLFQNPEHEFTDEITHILIRKAVE